MNDEKFANDQQIQIVTVKAARNILRLRLTFSLAQVNAKLYISRNLSGSEKCKHTSWIWKRKRNHFIPHINSKEKETLCRDADFLCIAE